MPRLSYIRRSPAPRKPAGPRLRYLSRSRPSKRPPEPPRTEKPQPEKFTFTIQDVIQIVRREMDRMHAAMKPMAMPEPGLPGMDGSPDTPDEIKTKLESLKGDARLDKSAIKGIQEQIDALQNSLRDVSGRKQISGGGGNFSEVLATGTIDEVNTVFTFPKVVSRAAEVWVYKGGAFQSRLAGDYTISLSIRTITFTVPPVVGEVIVIKYR